MSVADSVENLAHLGITGNLADAEESLDVALAALLVELEQRGTLEREDGVSRHQRIGDGYFRILAWVGDLFEA